MTEWRDQSDTLTPIQFALPSKHKRSVFDTESLDVLKCLYCKVNPSCSITDVIVNSVFLKYASLTLKGKNFSSSGKRTRIPYIVNVHWNEDLYGLPPTTLPSPITR